MAGSTLALGKANLNVLGGLSGGGADRQRLASALQLAEDDRARLKAEIRGRVTDADRWGSCGA
jgi:hypothetical protein